jgi:FdhD protein
MDNKILKEVDYTRVDSVCTNTSERIVKETTLTINIEGRHLITVMILPAREKEFVFGYLYTQGIINRAGDVASITVKNDIAEVILSPGIRKRFPVEVLSDFKINHEDVFRCVQEILKSEIFAETEAVHSAGLFLEGREPVLIAEDLGRHNALDKVIGGGLLQGVDFRRTLASSTGRQPSEMLYKCRQAGIPIIATKGVPTTLAIEIAEKAGITIAGLVRGQTMIVYSHPERIL